MHPSIVKIPNSLFYNNLLKNGENTLQLTTSIVNSEPRIGHSIIFYNLIKLSAFCFSEEKSHSRFNIVSAFIAALLAYNISKNSSYNIGIITPYNSQARLIHRLLKDLHLTEKVKSATVHRFQGSEQEVIIFDMVEGHSKKPGLPVKGGIDNTSARLSNVAISRAKGKFICLGNY